MSTPLSPAKESRPRLALRLARHCIGLDSKEEGVPAEMLAWLATYYGVPVAAILAAGVGFFASPYIAEIVRRML